MFNKKQLRKAGVKNAYFIGKDLYIQVPAKTGKYSWSNGQVVFMNQMPERV